MNNIYENELFFRIIHKYIPLILQRAYKKGINFAVKGGKSVDAYLEEEIGSPDWDLIMNSKSEIELMKNFIIDNILKTSPNLKLNTSIAYLDTIPIYKIGILYGDDFVDIAYVENFNFDNVEIINKIPYISLTDIINDLEHTVKDRETSYNEAASISESEEILEERIKQRYQESEDMETKIRNNIDLLYEKISKDKSTKKLVEQIRDDFDEYVSLIENYAQLNSYENRREIKKFLKDLDMQKIKLLRTQLRLTSLKDAIQNIKGLNKKYLLKLHKICENDHKKIIHITDTLSVSCEELIIRHR